MKIISILIFVVGALVFSAQESPPLVKRYAFIIGGNDGGHTKTKLKYATWDARSIAKVMAELGGVDPIDSILVTNPTRSELLEHIYEMKNKLWRNRLPSTRTELFFYYSGHSDDEGLLLGEEKLSYPELKQRIKDMSADLSIIVLDSCASGNLTRIKGGHKAPPFLSDALSKLKGYVALTSSSSDEAAQESDRIKGSYFTHYLVSGLRGAADFSSRNRVTLNEAYQYAYNQTLARTERTVSGAQHPSYSIQLTGSGELVMTDLRRISAKVILEKDLLGRVFIRDKSDNIVAEVDKISHKPLAIGLEAGEYSLVSFKDSKIGKARVKLAANHYAEVRASDFSPIEAEITRVRGGASIVEEIEGESGITNIPAEFSVLPGASTNVIPSNRTANNFSMSLLYAEPARVSGLALSALGGTRIRDSMEGAQISPFFNTVGKTATGVQISAGYNRVPKLIGVQIGGFNSSETVTGFQIGGFNRTEGEVVGVQIGGANMANKMDAGAQIGGLNQLDSPLTGTQIGGINLLNHPLTGAQFAGLYNQTPMAKGLQAGAINIAEVMNGVQIGGVVNDSKTMKGVQVALLNSATSISGAQIGAANIASDISGIQLGMVNYGASEEGVTVGLVNLPQRGQFRVSYSFDDLRMHQFAIKYGTRYSYSFLQLGTTEEKGGDRLYDKSAGLGGDIPFKRFSLNIEALVSRIDKINFTNAEGIWIAQTRLMPRYRITDMVAVFAGASLNMRLNGNNQDFLTAHSKSVPSAFVPWVGYLGGVELLL